jgi:hypothetical protein
LIVPWLTAGETVYKRLAREPPGTTDQGGLDLLVREGPAIVRCVKDGVHLEIWGEGDSPRGANRGRDRASPVDRSE